MFCPILSEIKCIHFYSLWWFQEVGGGNRIESPRLTMLNFRSESCRITFSEQYEIDAKVATRGYYLYPLKTSENLTFLGGREKMYTEKLGQAIDCGLVPLNTRIALE